MNRYMKAFILMSVAYLCIAVFIGVYNGIVGTGMAENFAHTHFNLLGFMSMMVFGIGYFIIPRFNATELKFPGWVAPHFWLANISLVGMVSFNYFRINADASIWETLFILFAILQAISVLMFVGNMSFTILGKPQAKQRSQPASSPNVAKTTAFEINGSTKVADLIDRFPAAKEILIKQGVGALAMPGHIDKVREFGITLSVVANNHRLDIGHLLSSLKAVADTATPQSVEIPSQAAKPKIRLADLTLSKDTIIGDIMEACPQTESVFAEHFGSGCFDCPGQLTESIELACNIHGVDPSDFLDKLREKIK